ncbi:hypothetical protein [Streptomyces sp. CBMA156]|uniref:hypothetical protein n=1 Tax=Streptomyces sp. CBMA156 TaxID=1930280 RepID=UPI001661FF17|nr:hypothetical protein [Streptomyces sp. CBMA156]MBD0671441.1 hypothetical protein [Streptomyces sp. CBMA156]
MANCTSCGATSGEGAAACGSCGRPFAPPAPPQAPPAVPPPPPGAAPSVPPPGYGPPPGLPPGGAPEYGPGGSAVAPPAPPALGSWGAGQPYDREPALRRLLTGADWRPAVRAAVAPTLVLLAAALIAAVPGDYRYEYWFPSAAGFGERFGASLSMALNALGAPFRLGLQGPMARDGAGRMEVAYRVLPMTVTALWCLALWLGLRAGLRRRKALEGQLSRGRAAGEALRTALVLAAVSAVIGPAAGTRWHPSGRTGGLTFVDPGSGKPGGPLITAGSGWPEAVAWTAVLAGLLAFVVYGTDALRWAAWRNRAVRGWAVAALTAGQAMAVTVGLSSLAAFVLVAVNGESGARTGISLAFLPNLGLTLLGFGSGATFRSQSGLFEDGEAAGDSWQDGDTETEFSFFDLQDQTADWRWAGLLALLAAGLLGWAAFRRRLDTVDRLRLAAVQAGALTLLMTFAGTLVTRTTSTTGWAGSARTELSQEESSGLVFLSVLVANALWALAGVLLVPPLLAAVRGRGAGAPSGAVPYAESPFAPSRGSAPQGPGPQGFPSQGPGPYPAVPPEVPYATPARGVPAQGAPAQAMAAQDAPFATGGGVSEVLASHEVPPGPAGGTPVSGAVPPPPAEEPVDPSVWREHP